MIGSALRTRVGYVAEASYGAPPASPSFATLRRVSGGMHTNKGLDPVLDLATAFDATAVINTSQDVAGSYDFEFSTSTFDLLVAAALGGQWSANVLLNGSLAPSLTFEETIDLNGALSYHRFIGCLVDQLALSFQPMKLASGSIALVGSQELISSAPLTGATYANATDALIDTAVSVGSISVGGVSPTPKIVNLALSIANDVTVVHDVVSIYGTAIRVAKSTISGRVDAYFESAALYQQALNHAQAAISFTFGRTGGSRYQISIPVAQWMDGSKTLGGKNDDVIASLPFRALYSSTLGGSIQITRGVA